MPLKVQIAKIYGASSVRGTSESGRVTTYSIRVPVTVMNLVILGIRPDLPTCKGREFHAPAVVGWEVRRTSRGINDQQDRGHEREEKDGRGEDGSCGPTLD